MITFDVGEESVFYCTVDHGFSISLEKSLSLRIEADFDFVDATGTLHRITTEDDPTTCGPALALSRATVVSMQVQDGGRLEMSFTDGSHLAVEPLPRYEAWTTAEANGAKVVCMAEGELVIFDPRPDDG